MKAKTESLNKDIAVLSLVILNQPYSRSKCMLGMLGLLIVEYTQHKIETRILRKYTVFHARPRFIFLLGPI